MTARMREVAQRAGVSLKTVSNVINHYPHVTPATRAKVETAIAELDYRPNLGARSLRSGRYDVIALAIPDLAQPQFAGLAAAIGRAAKNRGVAVLVEQTEGDAAAEELVLDGLRDRLVDGILLWPTAVLPATSRCMQTSSACTTGPTRPLILLGDERSDLDFDRVSLDNSQPSIASSISLGEVGGLPSGSHEKLADAAVRLLLDRVAGGDSPVRRHVVVQP